MNVEYVTFGSRAIGLATAVALHERGETVRVVNRSGHAAAPDGVEIVAGNAADPAFTAAVATGARVVYQSLNPPYHRWPEQFPALRAGVLAAARATGARMVSMDNVYSSSTAPGWTGWRWTPRPRRASGSVGCPATGPGTLTAWPSSPCCTCSRCCAGWTTREPRWRPGAGAAGGVVAAGCDHRAGRSRRHR